MLQLTIPPLVLLQEPPLGDTSAMDKAREAAWKGLYFLGALGTVAAVVWGMSLMKPSSAKKKALAGAAKKKRHK